LLKKLNINTHAPAHSGSCSHPHQQEDTLSLNGDNEDEEEKMPLLNEPSQTNTENIKKNDGKSKKLFFCC